MKDKEFVISEANSKFISNFKKLLSYENMTQKDLSRKMNVLESTVSKCNKKLPSSDFLINLKNVFPDLSIDTMLFGDLDDSLSNKDLPKSILTENISKYKGSYLAYYLDTNRKRLHEEIPSIGSIIRVGLIFISDNISSKTDNKAPCVAIFGLRKRSDAEGIKKATEDMHSLTEVIDFLQNYKYKNLYKGTFDLSQSHIFINLEQDERNKDAALIILHHTNFNGEKYIGGLGTINSTSTGRPSDPVVQVVAISRSKLYLSDEELFKKLLFFKPTVNPDSTVKEILALAKQLYNKKAKAEISSISDNELEVYRNHIPEIIESDIIRLLKKNIELNTLWFGKVSGDADQEWYEKLKQQNTEEEPETND